MKKPILGMGASLLLATSLLVFSCQKDTPPPANAPVKTAMAQMYQYSDMPEVQNGMLVFRDTAQFYNYLNFLDSAMEDPTDTMENDDILQGIESSIGFESIRSVKHAAFVNIEDDKGWATLDEAVQDETWVPKDIASILNANHDAQVGSNIIHFINKNLQVVVAINNDDILDKFHDLDTSATVENALNIDQGRLFSSVFDYKFGGSFVLGSIPINYPTGTGPLKDNFSIVGPQITHPCGYPTRIIFKHLTLLANSSMPLTNVAATYHIDFGDGTSTNVSSPTFGAYYYVPDFSHDYPSNGSYTMTIKAHPNGYATNLYVEDTRNVLVDQSSCKLSNQDYSSGWHKKAIDGSHWLFGQVSLDHVQAGQFNVEKSVIHTETKLVKKRNNGNYARYRGSKTEHETCQPKDNSCNNYGAALEGHTDGKKKTISMHRTKNGVFYFSEIDSDHHYGSTSLTINYLPCN